MAEASAAFTSLEFLPVTASPPQDSPPLGGVSGNDPCALCLFFFPLLGRHHRMSFLHRKVASSQRYVAYLRFGFGISTKQMIGVIIRATLIPHSTMLLVVEHGLETMFIALS